MRLPRQPVAAVLRIDFYAALGVRGRQVSPIRQWLRVPWRATVQRFTPGIGETPRAVIAALHLHAAFMHRAMVEPAQRGQVRQFGLAAIRPVLDVVPVHVALVIAPREYAAFVARRERTAHRRRDTAGLATDIERLALLVFGDLDLAAIAREATRGFDRNRRAVVELAATGLALAQRGFVDVHHDLMSIAAFHCSRAVLQEAFGHDDERIGTTHGVRGRRVPDVNVEAVPLPSTFQLKRAANLYNHPAAEFPAMPPRSP